MATAAVKEEQAGTPDWLTETPEEPVRYGMEMYEDVQGTLQQISMTREEFIYLKRCLALKQGHIFFQDENEVTVERFFAFIEDTEAEGAGEMIDDR